MTGALDIIARGAAQKIIGKYGKAVTLIRVTEGFYDPTASSATNTEASESVDAVLDEYKPYELANGLAVVGDKRLTIAASGLTAPNLTDAVLVDAVRFSIVSLQTVYGGELPALYILQARKA